MSHRKTAAVNPPQETPSAAANPPQETPSAAANPPQETPTAAAESPQETPSAAVNPPQETPSAAAVNPPQETPSPTAAESPQEKPSAAATPPQETPSAAVNPPQETPSAAVNPPQGTTSANPPQGTVPDTALLRAAAEMMALGESNEVIIQRLGITAEMMTAIECDESVCRLTRRLLDLHRARQYARAVAVNARFLEDAGAATGQKAVHEALSQFETPPEEASGPIIVRFINSPDEPPAAPPSLPQE